jgi:hypothetical protein
MSFAGTPLEQFIMFSPPRNIGGIVATATVSERGTDEVTITEHPVENTAPIADHSYLRPAELVVRIGFQESIVGVLSGSGSLQDIYNQLLAMEWARQPISVVTGKRTYPNMLITLLDVETDEETENVLVATVHLRQVFLVSTQTTPTTSASVQQNPESNSPVQNQGSQNLGPGTSFNPAAFL